MDLLRSQHHRALDAIVRQDVPRAHGPDYWERRAELPSGPRAVVVLYLAANAADGDGFPAIYLDLDLDAEELVEAAAHVGAAAHAALFRRVEQVLPADARDDRERLCDFVLEHEERFEAFDAAYYALEDRGDVLIEHLIRYLLAHPDEFAPYRRGG
ncbi:hypothetical protein [Egicoccus sp. AB-alg2]|uniref:DMP19 family protein n=1 Tax=Egicoccus sp. AB-alg2 TaxID=3242693 RepID=UPI00359CFF71